MSGYVFDTKHDRYPLAVHVFLVEHGRILLMRRAGRGYADGRLGLPTSHVDRGEAPTASAVREIAEELGITLAPADLRPSGTMVRLVQEARVDIFLTAESWAGTPVIREPHKCTELVWADPEDLPGDALDFLATAWADAKEGRLLREFGFAPVPN
ncbi:NUDIX domain-containing protein [Nocardia sp. NBC_00416]|uniref:NUDIX domain-containing protein n=1 Tax=Nocardia sp. NBC_00416 TaxID=2975991 RepID=UPI002E1AF96E